MTIFRQIPELERGLKDCTRRVVKPGEVGIANLHGGYSQIMQHNRLKLRVGQDYAIVPKRGQKSIGRYQLLRIEQERLQNITETSAKAEGFEDMVFPPFYRTSVLPGQVFSSAREGYEALWESINTRAPYRWQDNPLVWVLTFKVLHINGKVVQP